MNSQTLKGKYPHFAIKKWFAIDRGSKVAQYVPTYKGKTLVSNPLRTLKDAHDVIDDWQGRINFYKRTKKKEKIYEMLKKRNMI